MVMFFCEYFTPTAIEFARQKASNWSCLLFNNTFPVENSSLVIMSGLKVMVSYTKPRNQITLHQSAGLVCILYLFIYLTGSDVIRTIAHSLGSIPTAGGQKHNTWFLYFYICENLRNSTLDYRYMQIYTKTPSYPFIRMNSQNDFKQVSAATQYFCIYAATLRIRGVKEILTKLVSG